MPEQDIHKDPENKELLKNDGKDLDRLASWIGRVEKNAKDQTAAFAKLSEQIEALGKNKKPEFGDEEQDKFNEKLHEMILNGRVVEALNMVNKVNREAESLIKKSDQKKFDKAMSALAEDPIMKNQDLAKKVSDSAQALVKQGYTPEAAVSTAKATVENEALRGMIQSGGSVSLDMLGGGSGDPPKPAEKRFPPGAEKAYQMGKEKGLFKDRKDYLEHLDPRVRDEWGL